MDLFCIEAQTKNPKDDGDCNTKIRNYKIIKVPT